MSEIIDALQLVPPPFRENDVMVMVTELFNVLMDKDLNASLPNIPEIQAAYYDATYKLHDYSQLSFEAKKQLLHEMGFDYITEFINITESQITQLLLFLNIIYILKGKEEGLRLILDTLGIVYDYTTWDETSPKGCPFTATLLITGGNFDNYTVLSNLKNFLRSYMLPWIEVVIQLVIEAPPLYAYPSHGRLIRLLDTTTHTCSRDVDQRVAIYDLDDGYGYDRGLYGRNSTWGTEVDVPAPPLPIEYATVTINALPDGVAIVEINGEVRNSLTVETGTQITWRVYADGYVEQSGNFTITSDTVLDIELSKIVIPSYTFRISAVPSNATVIINGQTRTSITAQTGTSITWSVSADNYISQSGSLTLTKDEYLVVTLEAVPQALFQCYYISLQSEGGVSYGNAYVYAPATLSMNLPLYFYNYNGYGYGIQRATSSSQLIQAPLAVFTTAGPFMLRSGSPFRVTAYSNNIITRIDGQGVNAIGGYWGISANSITRMPEYDLYD